MTQPVIPLQTTSDKSLVGGKAWSLQQLLQEGFQIPGGFVISTQTNQQMTPTLIDHIWQHFDNLNSPYVAVRSSAVAEDGQTDAWAGQLDTLLNVTRADLLSAIEQCWQSINSTRAQAYAAQKQLSLSPVAVIVQAMVQSDVSGVAFSVHPVTLATDQIIIEAGWGLGEAIVSGQITPDTYITTKQDVILDKQVSNQTKKMIKNTSGQTSWVDIPPVSTAQKLTDQQIVALSRLVRRLEAYYQFPVDVEWALANDQLYILQSRPITTLT